MSYFLVRTNTHSYRWIKETIECCEIIKISASQTVYNIGGIIMLLLCALVVYDNNSYVIDRFFEKFKSEKNNLV